MSDKNSACGACQDGAGPGFPFTMAFQPIIDTVERRVHGYEALVRGPGGESAGSILGRVTPETRYAFDQGCRVKAIELAARLGIDRRLSINFLPNAVYEPKACIRATLAAADRFKFPLDLITFEITEDERISDTGHLLGIINEYRRHGFRIALDDFGAGFSGLNVLVELQPDAVKLDRALISAIDTDLRKRTITRGMIQVCHDLGIDVVAEGVERREELDLLREAGVRYIQGYLFAKPALEQALLEADIPLLATL